MIVIKSRTELEKALVAMRGRGQSIGLVPTMGFLHEGHLSLIRLAKSRCDCVVLSHFVNPTQFNEKSDYEKYPRDLAGDIQKLSKEQVDFIYAPAVDQIYPVDSTSTRVCAGSYANELEGSFRPGHFDGVVTVISILFNQVRPNVAVFGEKDFQQIRVIEGLVTDLSIPVTIIRGPIVREKDGLAMSSRNVRLSTEKRVLAPKVFEILSECIEKFQKEITSVGNIVALARERFFTVPEFQLEYFSIIDEKDLGLVSENLTSLDSDVQEGKIIPRIVTAVWLDGVRLIDTVNLIPA